MGLQQIFQHRSAQRVDAKADAFAYAQRSDEGEGARAEKIVRVQKGRKESGEKYPRFGV